MAELRKIPVRIEGGWQPVAYVGQLHWRGVAAASEPITALALLRTGQGISWSRAGRGSSTTLAIDIKVEPRSDAQRLDVQIWMTIRPDAAPQRAGQANIWLRPRLTSGAPLMFSLDRHRTGEPGWLAEVWSAEKERLGVLLVAEADTRSKRAGLWRLRDGVVAFDGWEAALNLRRSGRL